MINVISSNHKIKIYLSIKLSKINCHKPTPENDTNNFGFCVFILSIAFMRYWLVSTLLSHTDFLNLLVHNFVGSRIGSPAALITATVSSGISLFITWSYSRMKNKKHYLKTIDYCFWYYLVLTQLITESVLLQLLFFLDMIVTS